MKEEWLIQLFSLKKYNHDILLVQIYMDGFIFGATNEFMSRDFSNIMQSKFEMSLKSELFYFLGLQIHQTKE